MSALVFGGPESRRSRYNRQIQPWRVIPTDPYIEHASGSPLPCQYFPLPPRDPYEPLYGYKEDEGPRMRPINGMLDSYCTSQKMTGGQMKFPNLVSAIEKEPKRAVKSALYTRNTPAAWFHSNLRNYNEADTNRNYSERLRGDFVKVMRETDEITSQSQKDVDRRLGERITDITFWRNELRKELEKLLTENDLLQECRRKLEKALADTEGPLHVVKECLYQRENREGIDLVHDQPEIALLYEVELYTTYQEKLRAFLERIRDQLRTLRSIQHELECDISGKDSTLGIDHMCHQLNNYSRGINYYSGVEKYDLTTSNPNTWAEFSNKIIVRSQAERGKSVQMRSDGENLVNTMLTQAWDAWSNTNNALSRRVTEMLEAKTKLQMHLHRTQQEIFDVEKHIELLKRAINDKRAPMQVAQTRLEARTHRKNIELCKDNPHDRLVQEVVDLQGSIDYLYRKLQEAEAQHQQLLQTRATLESDLNRKVKALFIDREKCMGMRRAYPITATVSY